MVSGKCFRTACYRFLCKTAAILWRVSTPEYAPYRVEKTSNSRGLRFKMRTATVDNHKLQERTGHSVSAHIAYPIMPPSRNIAISWPPPILTTLRVFQQRIATSQDDRAMAAAMAKEEEEEKDEGGGAAPELSDEVDEPSKSKDDGNSLSR